MADIELHFVDSGFTTVSFDDITDGVLRSLEFVGTGISEGTLDSDLYIWGGDADGIREVIEEFSDWRSYHCCRLSPDPSLRSRP